MSIAERLDWIKRRPKAWIAYMLLMTAGWLGVFVFRVLNFTRVEGRGVFKEARRKHNGSGRGNVIIVSNHVTMFDSFFVGSIAYFPEAVFWPSVAPYHLAAEENFFTTKLTSFLMWCWRALPVQRDRRDRSVMLKVVELLPKANVHIFPSGRRSYHPLGQDPAKPLQSGVGYMLAKAPEPKPLVIPVYIGGVERIFGGKPGDKGTSRWLLKPTGILRRPLLRFGEPVVWQDLLEKHGNTREAWDAITQRIADAINGLNPSNARMTPPPA